MHARCASRASRCALGCSPRQPRAPTRVVRGRVAARPPGHARSPTSGPVVVYLEAERAPPRSRPPRRHRVHQKNAHFAPGFLAIAAGQSVAMPNDDLIFHNVFSYSKPNDFDLGLYAAGESRTGHVRAPGRREALLLDPRVDERHDLRRRRRAGSRSPTRTARFAIAGVPPGRHRLRTWNEKLPETEREIEVPASGDARRSSCSLVPGDYGPRAAHSGLLPRSALLRSPCGGSAGAIRKPWISSQPKLREQRALRLGLDALGDDAQPQRARHRRRSRR